MENDQASVVASLKDSHRRLTAYWKTSEQCKEAERFFRERILPLKTLKINQAICLALGSLKITDEAEIKATEQAPIFYSVRLVEDFFMTEFVAFQHWIELLREGGHEILAENVILQDPVFKAYDLDFITSFGYRVVGGSGLAFGAPAQEVDAALEDRTAQDMMTKETFAFIPCGAIQGLIEQCVEVAHPMLLITSYALQLPRHTSTPDSDSNLDLGALSSYDRCPDCLQMHMKRRQISRPFLSSHLFEPLFVSSNYPDGVPFVQHAPDSPSRPVPIILYWIELAWIYWKPDDESGLTRYEIEDDLECPCVACRKERDACTEKRLQRLSKL